MSNTKKPLIVLTGPTAVGKTALSISLAKSIGGEIISADSIQVYKHFDIGSAKITKEEMQGVPHHLLDVLEPAESFHVALFKELCDKAIADIYSRGHIPILTGGTGFYIQAVLNDIDFTKSDADDSYRQFLENELKEKGADYLYNMLKQVDPKSCETIHQNNHKRVIRALEYFHQTNQPISEHNETERQKTSPYNFLYFVLNMERDKLYERIEKRIDLMLEQGLVEEVKSLVANYQVTKDMVSMQGLGYKEILAYLNGKTTKEEAIEILKRDTRHFAKRQLTWFRREKEVIWIEKEKFANEEAILAYMLELIHNNNIM